MDPDNFESLWYSIGSDEIPKHIQAQLREAREEKNKWKKCSYCCEKYNQDDLVECDRKDCLLCEYCRTQCDICDDVQCPNTKKCQAPECERYNGRTCKKCNKMKSRVHSKRWHICTQQDTCPHPWCVKCEKHDKTRQEYFKKHRECSRYY